MAYKHNSGVKRQSEKAQVDALSQSPQQTNLTSRFCDQSLGNKNGASSGFQAGQAIGQPELVEERQHGESHIQSAKTPGVGIELETSGIIFYLDTPTMSEKDQEETVGEDKVESKSGEDSTNAVQSSPPLPPPPPTNLVRWVDQKTLEEKGEASWESEGGQSKAGEKNKDTEESFWKGRHLKDYENNGVKWALTIDTTGFSEHEKQFTCEIVVDGTTLKLDPKKNVMAEIGGDIQQVLLSPNELADEYPVDSYRLTRAGEISKDTIFSIQITCAMPMSAVYDLLKEKTVLNFQQEQGMPGEQYNLVYKSDSRPVKSLLEYFRVSDEGQLLENEDYQQFVKSGETEDIQFIPIQQSLDDKAEGAFICMLHQMFAGGAHDPKQNMQIMPRTSMGKIFTTFTKEQRQNILGKIENLGGVDKIGDNEPVTFQAYKQYLQALHQNMESNETNTNMPQEDLTLKDPIACHKEPLGIGKLKNTMETDFEGKEERPIFEFRRIGSTTLEKLPETLGKINDEILKHMRGQIAEAGHDRGNGV